MKANNDKIGKIKLMISKYRGFEAEQLPKSSLPYLLAFSAILAIVTTLPFLYLIFKGIKIVFLPK